jgi:hypothetical protein
MTAESDATLIIRAMREEAYVEERAWAGYAAVVDARALRIPRSAPRAISKEEAARVLRANHARVACSSELVAAGTLDIMSALTEIAERNAEDDPWEAVGATVGLEVCCRFVRICSASCAFKALADTHEVLAIYKALDAYVKAPG